MNDDSTGKPAEIATAHYNWLSSVPYGNPGTYKLNVTPAA